MNSAFNPNQMTGMLKNNVSMVLSNMIQLGWVNFFYKGFILSKVPFPLTQHFKGMLQNGIDIKTLDVQYVSSFSMYFIIMFGLSGL